MPPRTRLAVLAILALPFGGALAQTNSTPDTATLLQRIEEQDRRIEALEHKLEVLESQQATVKAGGASVNATPASVSANAPAAGAVAAAQAQRGRQANSAPPVPQTTGALPGSPSTAVQGAT